ncbi:MAG: DUF2852 domain-containing protein [Rhodomicrobium sp.]
MHLAARLDDIGKPAWIALMVVSFIIWWPIGLAALAFLLWSGRMGCGYHGNMSWHERRERWREMRDEWRAMRCGGYGATRSSGNTAFDDYRTETLKRLEDEQKQFSGFLDRLRRAKDKAEFDQFMAERRNTPPGEASNS